MYYSLIKAHRFIKLFLNQMIYFTIKFRDFSLYTQYILKLKATNGDLSMPKGFLHNKNIVYVLCDEKD